MQIYRARLRRRARAWPVLLAGLALAGGGGVMGVAAQASGSLNGQVVAAATGQPLADVDVFLEGSGRRVVTDRNGAFALGALPAGTHALVAERIGFGSVRQVTTVTAGQATSVTLRLDDEAVSMPEVIVTATREARALAEVAASVGVVGSAEIRTSGAVHPSDLMDQIPGVYLNTTGGEGHMTAIRQPLSTAPLYLYLENGVPTRSTGFFNHNALYEVNVPQADRIEVMKGPSNALYGSDAIGGVINVATRAPTEELEGELSVESGEHGYQRYMASLSGTLGGHGLRADLNVTRTDGWRRGTDYDRVSGTLRWDVSPWTGSSLSTLLTYSTIDQNTAGSSALSRIDFESHPRLNYTPISFREVMALRVSSALEARTGRWSLSVTPYARLNSMDLLPNWSLTYDPTVWETENSSLGVLAKATWTPAGTDAHLTVGADVDYSPGSHFERAIEPTREGSIFTSYEDGAPLYDYDVTFKQLSPYLHLEWTPTDRLHLTGGLRADFLGYDYDNRLTDVQAGRHRRPADGSPTFRALSPKLGATVELLDDLVVYGAYRRGFRAPSEGQLFRQGSADNTMDLDPVHVDSYEIGARTTPASWLSAQVSAYHMSKTDDILGFRNPDGSTESVNAGETLHRGIELGLGVRVMTGVRIDAAYSVAEHSYTDWRPEAGLDFSGNEQEDAPNEVGSVGVTLSPPSLPADVTVEWRRIGPYWMDAANTAEYGGHDLLSVRTVLALTDRIDVFARVDNVTDERYAETATYTAFRGQELAPGLPRTFYAGVRIR